MSQLPCSCCAHFGVYENQHSSGCESDHVWWSGEYMNGRAQGCFRENVRDCVFFRVLLCLVLVVVQELTHDGTCSEPEHSSQLWIPFRFSILSFDKY